MGSSDGFNVIMRPPAAARAISTVHQPSPAWLHYQLDGDSHSRTSPGQFRHHSIRIMTPLDFTVPMIYSRVFLARLHFTQRKAKWHLLDGLRAGIG